MLLDLARHYLGEAWTPDWVEATTKRVPDRTALEDRFGSNVWIAMDLPGIAVRKTDLAARNPEPPEGSAHVVLNDLPCLTGSAPPQSVADEVRLIMQMQLIDGDLSVDTIARNLATGVRSLQRALQAEGTSFPDVQQQFLKERATTLLAESDLTVQEIARLLGYDGSDSFRRAFVRWTGMPPSHYAHCQDGSSSSD